ncbi:MAG: UDP-2,3-diacylglucosamine diphosphatase [Bacteroidota bacterium]
MESWRHPNDRYLLLGDLHLGSLGGEAGNELEREAVELLEYCREADLKLLLLGDLFDYWMEYPGHVPHIAPQFREALANYNRVTGPTLYITGNHDNWTRSYFDSIGCVVCGESIRLQIDNSTLLLLHGDGLADPDMNLPRPIWHRLLRSPSFIRLYQAIFPSQTGLRIMAAFSSWSRKKSANSPVRLDRWARETLEIGPDDFVICGHDHTPRIRHSRGGTYINCGAFLTSRTAVRYTNGQPEIVVWNAGERQLTPWIDPKTTQRDGR